jgi:hypothetical protein
MLEHVIQQGIALMTAYLSRRVQAGELRADLPLETSARLFFSTLIVFFLSYRALDDIAWEARATPFIGELLSIWMTGTPA